jgi:hypothetical protein
MPGTVALGSDGAGENIMGYRRPIAHLSPNDSGTGAQSASGMTEQGRPYGVKRVSRP